MTSSRERSEASDPPVRSVFVGGPFYGVVDPRTGTVGDEHKHRLQWMFSYFESRGVRVYNAHRREEWGARFLGDSECTKLDFDEIAEADMFVAFPGETPSPGTHVEFGWASALGKPIIALLRKDHRYASLIMGLASVANMEFVYFDEEFGSEVFERDVTEAVQKLLRTGQRG